MSAPVYTTQEQLRYVMQWFHEWSELQRGDFVPILAHRFAPDGVAAVNGLVDGLVVLQTQDGRPPSLFQCRVKLFREWSQQWGHAELDHLINEIKATDPDFVAKFEAKLRSMSSGNATDENEETKVASPVHTLSEDDN